MSIMSVIPAHSISCSIQQNDRNTLLQLLEELKKNRLPLPAGDKNWTALHYAASQPQYKEYLELLLEYSDSILMDVNGETDDCSKTALHIACENCCEESVLILLQKGCDPYKVTSGEVVSGYYKDRGVPQENGKFSALHIAVAKGCSKIVEYLLDYPENINKPDNWGQTPLHQAAAGKSNSKVGRILFEKGANVRSIDGYGNSPLHCACLSNNLDMIQFLVECDSTLINCTNFKGCTPLMLAADNGVDVCGVRILCENGAKIDICDESGWTALHCAAANGKVEVLECILQYTETSCFEAWFSNKLNNVLNAGGTFVSLTCACITLKYQQNEECLEMLLSSNKLSPSILQAPIIKIDFRKNICEIYSPLAYLFICMNYLEDEKFNSYLQLLLKYKIIMLDEFFKVHKVKWPECSRIEFASPFEGILQDRLPLSKIHHYFHLLNANGITIDYSLQC